MVQHTSEHKLQTKREGAKAYGIEMKVKVELRKEKFVYSSSDRVYEVHRKLFYKRIKTMRY